MKGLECALPSTSTLPKDVGVLLQAMEQRFQDKINMLVQKFQLENLVLENSLRESRDNLTALEKKLVSLEECGSEAKPKSRTCEVCGGTTGIHKHRELGLLLDDRCRKQVDTVKYGSVIIERRDEWIHRLGKMPSNEVAQKMLKILNSIPSKKRKHEEVEPEQGTRALPPQQPTFPANCNNCTVCQHPILEKSIQLPCSHAFHEGCIGTWLKECLTCPVCRASVSDVSSTGLLREPSPKKAQLKREQACGADTTVCDSSACESKNVECFTAMLEVDEDLIDLVGNSNDTFNLAHVNLEFLCT